MMKQLRLLRSISPKQWLKIGTIGILSIVALLLAWTTFTLVRDFVSTWNITSLPGLALDANPTPVVDAGGEAASGGGEGASDSQGSAAPIGPTPDPWDGASRVNILVMGLDYNDWRGNEGPPRTDTMILFSIDPLTKSAGMLSIPRDLWVLIPGFEHGRINTAYQLGEAYKLPNGGPGLAMKTVEALLGVPIQYYAQIDFTAFVTFIDELGGLKMDIPYEIYVDIYDDPKGKIRIEPGVQTLPGEYVLAYARVRTTQGGDFDRSMRQQQVVMAIRRRILDFNMFPKLLSKASTLYQELSSGINTNMTLDEAIQLAWLALDIPQDQIYTGIINTEHVSLAKSPEGWDILIPIPDKIRVLRDEIFAPAEMTGPLFYEGKEPKDLMMTEGARLTLLNGTATPGLATRTSDYFQSLGATVLSTGDADATDYASTNIYDHTGNPYTLKYFKDLMGLNAFRIHSRFRPDSETDVTIILGADWAANNPMP
jgi:LCP family protein required for cell wall assembly